MRKFLPSCATISLIAALPAVAQVATHSMTAAAPTPAPSSSAGRTTTVSSTPPMTPSIAPATVNNTPTPLPTPTPTPEVTPTPTPTPGVAEVPLFANSVGARLVYEPVPMVEGITAEGERVGTAPAAAPSPPAGATLAAVELDRAAVREERREARKVARNGQRLYSIAPRTNVDRSDEMPDDPVSPAISPPDRRPIRY